MTGACYATADTAQEAALTEGLAPLMGWVKRLCDHVMQDRMGQADLEFAWLDERPVRSITITSETVRR